MLARARAGWARHEVRADGGPRRDQAEVLGVLADLRAVGVDIVTIGQYLRPTVSHLPVARWWAPSEFAALGQGRP